MQLSWNLPSSSLWQNDLYGVLHKLYFNESIPASSEGLLRILGFVHLYTASGIHVYAFLNFMEWLSEKTSLILFRSKWIPMKWVFRVIAFLILAMLWSLQGWRLGFVRPVLTYLLRQFGKAHGLKFRIFAPILFTYLNLNSIFKRKIYRFS